jgi:hypothetical protein
MLIVFYVFFARTNFPTCGYMWGLVRFSMRIASEHAHIMKFVVFLPVTMKIGVVSTSNQVSEPPTITFWELFIYFSIETASQHVGIDVIFYSRSFKAGTHHEMLGVSSCEREIFGGFHIQTRLGTTQNCILIEFYVCFDRTSFPARGYTWGLV